MLDIWAISPGEGRHIVVYYGGVVGSMHVWVAFRLS